MTCPQGQSGSWWGHAIRWWTSKEIRAYAERLTIDLVLTPGDHFFHGRGKKIGDLVAQGFEPPSNSV